MSSYVEVFDSYERTDRPGAQMAALVPAAVYTLVSDGSTVTAYDQAGRIVSDGTGTDGSAALTAVLPDADSAGATILFRNDGNVFPWNSVPALPKGITNKLLIDLGGATVQLSSNGPRFLDFGRTADYDTFQNIEIRNGTIDANSIGGLHHVIIGTYAAGANSQRINVQSLTVRDIRAINVLQDSNTGTNHRLGIWIITSDAAAGNATTLNDILIENVRIEGGNAGVGIGCVSATNLVSCDRVTIRGCWHDTGVVPTALYGSTNYQIGAYATVGQCLVENCYGANAGDDGVEINNATAATVRGCHLVDAWGEGVLVTNFVATSGQIVRIVDCLTEKINMGTGNTICRGIAVGGANDSKIGTVVFENCIHRNTSQDLCYADAIRVSAAHPTGGVERIVIRNCKAYVSGFNQDVTSPLNAYAYIVSSAASKTTIIEIDGLYAEYAVTRGAGSTQSLFYGTLGLEGTGIFDLRVNDVSGSFVQTNEVSTSAQMINLSVGSEACTIRGFLRGLAVVTGGSGQIGIRASGNVTYQNVQVVESDFTNVTAGSEVSHAAATNKGLIHQRGNRYASGTVPVPAGLTGLSTGVGQRLNSGWDALVTFTQGSGTAITAIDYSTNGGTTYTNFLTQASGALPAGFDQALGPLTSDALIKVTFTGTQPTITLVPANP